MKIICGVDEAGRGALAGPVFAAAVVLDPTKLIYGLKDSKKLSFRQRNFLFYEIQEKATAYAISFATAKEIDRINILQATMLAMKRAISALTVLPDLALIDGNQKPDVLCDVESIIKGDAYVPEISAASILAKVSRDQCMAKLDRLLPCYEFARHVGYGTKAHLAALIQHGPCEHHRKTFSPVKHLLI